MGTPPQILSQEYLHECLVYDPESGILTWRVRPLEHFKNEHAGKTWNTRYSGTRAGWPRGDGYLCVFLSGAKYYVHRLAWKMMNGHWPPAQIDHINQDRVDNRLSNLREVTKQENSRNASLRCDNSSGVTGVYWNASKNKWHAQIRVDGERIHLGYLTSKEAAIAARKAADARFGFHPNHGKTPCKS